MGHLAHYVVVRATRLEATVPWMIESAILAALTLLRASIDTLTTRVETCERRHGVTSEVTTLKVKVVDLRKDVDYLKSTYFTSLLEAADDVDASTTSKISPATTEDVPMDEVATDESEGETNKEQMRC
uniref:Polyprotein protein n=1 Tax=Solanum tuberosum TaxID=4113 RepID=M1DXJ0_SOLTU